MIYIEYSDLRKKRNEAQRIVDEILEEQEQLFAITQPGAVNYETVRSAGGTMKNRFDQYLILKEEKQIDERLREAKMILDERNRLLREKEEELLESKELQDRIYRYRYLDRLKISAISRRVCYSEPQVYRLLAIIRLELKRDRK